MNQNTKLRVIGFPQRLKDRAKPDKDGCVKRTAQPGEVFKASDHEEPELVLHYGLVEVVKDDPKED